jgi:hypothetical protein
VYINYRPVFGLGKQQFEETFAALQRAAGTPFLSFSAADHPSSLCSPCRLAIASGLAVTVRLGQCGGKPGQQRRFAERFVIALHVGACSS